MAIITKGVDNSASIYSRGVTFVSGTDFNSGDILDIENSIGLGAGHVTIDAGSGASCTYRINSLNKRYPLLSGARRLGFPAPDLENGTNWVNPETVSYSLAAGEVIELEDTPVANIEFTALVDTITVTVRN